MRDDRYSFLVLVGMSVVLAVFATLMTLYEIGQNNHKFCQIIHTASVNPAPKPVNPKANPSRERSYQGYIQFVNLGRSLGCGGPE